MSTLVHGAEFEAVGGGLKLGAEDDDVEFGGWELGVGCDDLVRPLASMGRGKGRGKEKMDAH